MNGWRTGLSVGSICTIRRIVLQFLLFGLRVGCLVIIVCLLFSSLVFHFTSEIWNFIVWALSNNVDKVFWVNNLLKNYRKYKLNKRKHKKKLAKKQLETKNYCELVARKGTWLCPSICLSNHVQWHCKTIMFGFMPWQLNKYVLSSNWI